MWNREVAAHTSASQETVWRAWTEVDRWHEWNGDVSKAELAGPFATGTQLVMTLGDGTAVDLRLDDVVPPQRFVDVASFEGVEIRTLHEVRDEGDARRVAYHVQVSGAAPAEALEEVGAQVTADLPEVLAALIDRAERSEN